VALRPNVTKALRVIPQAINQNVLVCGGVVVSGAVSTPAAAFACGGKPQR